MAGYTRQSTFVNGDTINASLFNNEYNQLLNAFAYDNTGAAQGHQHDGATGSGGNIAKIGDTTFINKIEVDAATDSIKFFLDVSGSATQKAVLKNSGLGIGTDTPTSLLSLKGTGGDPSGIKFENSNEMVKAYFTTDDENSDFTITYVGSSSAEIKLKHNGDITLAETTGNVGIGNGNPTVPLHFNGSTTGNAIQVGSGNSDVYQSFAGSRSMFGYRSSDGFTIVQGGGAKGIAFLTNNATFGSGEVMRITSAGDVGMGTTSPQRRLHIKDTIAGIRLEDSDNNSYGELIYNEGSNGLLIRSDRSNTDDGSNIIFDIDASEVARLGSTGRFGVGTQNPQESIHASGNIRFGDTTPAELYTNSAELRLGVDRNNDNGDSDITFYVNNAEKVRINEDGKVGIGTNNPQEELHISASVPKARLQDSDGTNQYGEFSHSNGTTSILARNNTTDGTIVFQKYDGTTTDETVRIDSSGNVGIGTINPASKLDVKTTGTTAETVAQFGNDNITGGLQVQTNGNLEWGFNAVNSRNLTFSTNQTERMRIDSSGNVGIGTNNPAKKLHVKDGDIRIEAAFPRLYLTDTDSNSDFSIINNNGKFSIYDDTNTTYRLAIDSTGKVGIGTINPAGNLHISSGTSGDATLILEADTDNDNEADNPKIQLRQDSAGVNGEIYMEGNSATSGVATLSNALVLEARDNNGNNHIQFVTGGANSTSSQGTTRMTIKNDGKIGINTTSPTSTLHVNGGITSTANMLIQKNVPIIEFRSADGTTNGMNIKANLDDANNYGLQFEDKDGNNRVVIDPLGDVSFYSQDSDTTAKFRWDASTERLGIGTSSPDKSLHIANTDAASVLRLERSNTELSGGQTLGAIEFESRDSSTGSTGVLGKIIVAAEDVSPDSRMGFFTHDNDNGTGTLTERMRITSLGRVGMGTLSPTKPLHVYHAVTDVVAEFESGDVTASLNLKDTGGISRVQTSSGNLSLHADTGNAVADSRIVFNVDNDEKMRLKDTGRLGIGTTNPQQKVEILGAEDTEYSGASDNAQSNHDATLQIHNTSTVNGSFASLVFKNRNTDQAVSRIVSIGKGAGTTDLAFVTEDSNTKLEKLRIKSTGRVGIGITTPGSRLHVKDDSGNTPLTVETTGTDANCRIKMKPTDHDGYSIGVNDNNSFTVYNIGADAAPFKIEGSAANDTLVLDDTSKVGIGLNNPASKLHVYSTDFAQLRLADADDFIEMGYSGAHAYFKTGDNDSNIHFRKQDLTDVMTLNMANNRVGINNITPGTALDVIGAVTIQSDTTGAAAAGHLVLKGEGGGMISLTDTNSDPDYSISALANTLQIKRGDTALIMSSPTDDNVGIKGLPSNSHALKVHGAAQVTGNLDVDGNATIDMSVTIDSPTTASLILNATGSSEIQLNDTNNNPDYKILNTAGIFGLRNEETTTNLISSALDNVYIKRTTSYNSGTDADFNVEGTIKATGAITCSNLTPTGFLQFDSTGPQVVAIKDEDDMTSNSATALATQQSIKAYVDSSTVIADGSITAAKYGNQSITGAKIASQTIGSGNISNSSLTMGQINPSTVISLTSTSNSGPNFEADNTTSSSTIHYKLEKSGNDHGGIGTTAQGFYATRTTFLMNGDLGVGIETSHSGSAVGGNHFKPMNSSFGNMTNRINLGNSSARWKQLFATSSTISTSDRNLKQQIASISEAERRVATAAKGLLRKFKYNDAVEEKGDGAARLHFGIVAQDLQDAFTAEGLDASNYGMFCSDTWWEHEGQTYDREDDAPEGATETTQLSIRYSELLAFIIAAI